jgi:hypothetical protein
MACVYTRIAINDSGRSLTNMACLCITIARWDEQTANCQPSPASEVGFSRQLQG